MLELMEFMYARSWSNCLAVPTNRHMSSSVYIPVPIIDVLYEWIFGCEHNIFF